MSESDNIDQDLESILEIVAKSENIKNYEFSINKKQGAKDGFLSDFFTQEIINKENNKIIHVAIKRATGFSPSEELGSEPFYKNEGLFYSKVFPELNKFQLQQGVKTPFNHVPRYLAGSADSKTMFVAMENLKIQDYVLYDKKKYLDQKHLEFIFRTYGKFHALSFTFKNENPEEYQNLIENFIPINAQFSELGSLIEHIQKTYLDVLGYFDVETEADILVKLKKVQNVKESVKNVQVYQGNYTCLTHGDCWSNNMLFKYKESGDIEDIKLLDFQLTCSSSPIYDLAYFFYSGASKEDMDKLDYYLDVYYESFSNFALELGGNPEELLSLDILKTEWKRYGLLGTFLGIMLWEAKLVDANEIGEIFNRKDISVAEYWELWGTKISELHRQFDYRERARNILLHAVEYGIL